MQWRNYRRLKLPQGPSGPASQTSLLSFEHILPLKYATGIVSLCVVDDSR